MLEVKNVSYAFENHAVLEDISLFVEKGETVAILGKSGVGKTTLFNLIAGILPLQTGQILLDGDEAIQGKISYMLQKDMLLPHKTILENLMLPMTLRGLPKEEAKAEGKKLLADFQLEAWADYYPKALSGGMRQRIALLRTTAFGRDWLLLDEAFSALDAMTRRSLHLWFMDYRKQFKLSSLLITHDIDEALILAQRIYVLGGQPGQVLESFSVPTYTGDLDDFIFSPEFLEKKRHLLNVLNASN